MTTEALGEEGFAWFIGVVEGRDDPLKLGRLKVRIYNTHSPNQSKTSTDELPWATVMSPVTGACNNRIGQAPLGIQPGTTVIGFFADGKDKNNPIILGGISGIPGLQADAHDVPAEAREINLVTKSQAGPEPASAYNAKYPYNKVIRTEAGHVIELDDTPNFERIHVYHKSGTYVEINEIGRMVTKTADDRISVVMKDDNLFVNGDVKIEVSGTVTGTASSWNITGDVNIKGNVNVQGNISSSGNSTSSGDVADKNGTMQSMRNTYNSHAHPDPQGGSTSTPSNSM